MTLLPPRQIDGEDTPFARQVAHVNRTAALLDALAADREPKAEPAAIGAPLLEHAKEILTLAGRPATTFILDFDLHAIDGRVGAQRHMTVGMRELERVLQQV